MTVDPGSPDLLWEQLADVLRQQLADGSIAPRRRIPTQEQLAETYSVSRGTVLKATNALVDEGLIRWVKGKGLYSADPDVIEGWKQERSKKRS